MSSSETKKIEKTSPRRRQTIRIRSDFEKANESISRKLNEYEKLEESSFKDLVKMLVDVTRSQMLMQTT
jgi:hypothetical protein